MKTINDKTLAAVHTHTHTLYLVNKLENKIKHKNNIAIT